MDVLKDCFVFALNYVWAKKGYILHSLKGREKGLKYYFYVLANFAKIQASASTKSNSIAQILFWFLQVIILPNNRELKCKLIL